MDARRVPPLLVTADMALADQIIRVAAERCVPLLVVGSARQARHWWQAAPLVLLGADLARSIRSGPRPPAGTLTLVTCDGSDLDLPATASELTAGYFAILRQAGQWLGDRLDACLRPPG